MGVPQINKNVIPFYKEELLDNGVNILYLEAGEASKPKLLLLHGFPTSSRQYKQILFLLAPYFHIIAPDLPGFGQTTTPKGYSITFQNIADSIELFLEAIKFDAFAVYVFDYGAPTAFRIALKESKRITAIITQNGNAYVEGLGKDFWNIFQRAWRLTDIHELNNEQKKEYQETLNNIRNALLDSDFYKTQYFDGEKEIFRVDPEAPLIDYHALSDSVNVQNQLDLALDYRKNVELYPRFHELFRKLDIPVLAVWGANDNIFIPDGAHAYKKDFKNVKVVELDAGHFASVTHPAEIAQEILTFSYENDILQ
ncbi:Alpha/Beta hydrolase protein [Scheffersomyces amazonensis]|uniref:Alpha/Beta hydrolase protein n=1 Tax=Scheffersomyces amazonensis TaxID=1078765 RepID=UPI00315CE2DF